MKRNDEDSMAVALVPAWVMTLIMLVITLLTNHYLPAWSDISYKLFHLAVALLGLILFDRYVLRGIKTFREIRDGNVAVALLVLSYAIIAAGTLSLF